MTPSKRDWANIKILISDFDGVFTDNHGYIDEHGKEFVKCSKADGFGITRLRESGIWVIVMSNEKNDVVLRRCEKLHITGFNKVDDKLKLFKEITQGYHQDEVCYMGNDVVDLECVMVAGIGVAVKDAYPIIKKNADYITKATGGNGAVREVAELILGGKL